MITMPVPINEAEAIFAPFWDTEISPFERYERYENKNIHAKFCQVWCYIKLEWNSQQSGGNIIGSLSSKVNVDIRGYDVLMMQVSMPDCVFMTVNAHIDGKKQVIILKAKGINDEEEYRGKISGKCLERIEIVFESDGIGRGGLYILWLGLANEEKLKQMVNRPNPYSPDWHGLLLPPDECPKNIEPHLNILFSSEELKNLRRKVLSPPYISIIEEMRKQAYLMSKWEPETFIGDFVSRGGSSCMFTRMRDRKPSPVVNGRFCAFIGLIDNDINLLRYAARCALSMAHCKTWLNGFMQSFPGSRWHERSFTESGYTMGCVTIWDWAGGVLTEQGRRVIRHAIATKGIPRIQQDFWEYEYIRHCNQGPAFATAWILAQIAISQEWKFAEDLVPVIEGYLRESILNCISDDGGMVEGLVYWSATAACLIGLYAFSRYKKMKFSDYIRKNMPEKFFKSIEFMSTMLRSGENVLPGSFLPIGDSGQVGGTSRIYLGSAVLMACATDDPAWHALAWDMLNTPSDFWFTMEPMTQMLLEPSIILGAESSPGDKFRIPVFSHLPAVGQLTSNRHSEFGDVRFHIIGSRAGAGHSHEDKGSFILEVNGETLLCDRGILNYNDPRCETQVFSTQHNLLIPVLPDGSESYQVNPCPESVIPQGSGDETVLHASIDTTPAWGGILKRHIRKIESNKPTQFIVIDEFELEKQGPLTFNLHSIFPIKQKEEGWIIVGEKASVLVIPRWKVESGRVFEDGIDHLKTPVNHLHLRSCPVLKDRFITELLVLSNSLAIGM